MSGGPDPVATGIEDTLAVGPKGTAAEPPEQEAAKRIGPYRLLQLVGEGGMGEVWLAEQLEPVRRRVAVKVIKAGMDTKQVVARFESERQALALMDHPAIAKVFDGGSTPEGRPYFVMEYVAGVSITEHCDTHKLSTRERLELLTEVCGGVQHAHQKAIIHRDLKPSNILVSLLDGRAQPKIIDFGIAKATGYRLTEKTLFTELGAVIGTPEYMSPEQADLTNQDVDTRTDVYSLGVILYQLLTGELPFASEDLRSSSYGELKRKLKEVEPPRPSTKLDTLEDGAADAAKKRNTDPRGLKDQLAGDLDAITMKAMEKERDRRYGTPSELAADIGRHLGNEPVLARPPSHAYRLQKYIRRHRVGVSIATGLFLLLVGFGSTMSVQARRIGHERDRANAERDRASREAARSSRVIDFMTGMFKVATPGEARVAREVLDHAAKGMDATLAPDPEIEAQLMQVLAEAYNSLGLPAQARELLTRAVDTRKRRLGPEHPDTLRSMSALALALYRTGDHDEGSRLARSTFEVERRVLGPEHPDTLRSMNLVGRLLSGDGRHAESEKLLRETLDLRRRVLGQEHQDTLWTEQSLALAIAAQGRLDEAEKMERRILDSDQRVLGPSHTQTRFAIDSLVALLVRQQRPSEAERLQREEFETERSLAGPDDPGTLSSMDTLATILSTEGRLQEAELLQRDALERRQRVLGPEGRGVASAQYDLACTLAKEGKRNEALAALREALQHGLDLETALGLAKDADLNTLHGDPRFETLVTKAKAQASPPH
jgi:eukaryotic-like serine/threonine-protein kinase